jgi:hypothetical protein
MKKLMLGLFGIIVFWACNNNEMNTPSKTFVNVKQTGLNDSFCHTGISKFNNDKLELRQACHIIFTDSLSDEIAKAYSVGKLSDEYNFDNNSSNLNFKKLMTQL